MLSETATGTCLLRNALRGWIGFVEASVLDWIDHGDVSRSELLDLQVRMAETTVQAVLGRPVANTKEEPCRSGP
jgi:hypothetical protein